MVFAQESGESVDPEQFEAGVRSAVKETVDKQVAAGVDVINDGEVSKPSYATYVKDRLTGFGGEGSIETVAASVMDLEEFPDFADHLAATMESVSEIRFTTEYEAIHEAGFILQLDCPDFAMTAPGAGSVENFRKQLQMSVEALNQALVNIPAQDTRIHICWGNGETPRTSDVELKEIIDLILQAKPAGLMLMASNGRHAHEWTVFEDAKLPDGKYVIPGVLDSTTNVVEHPEAIAQRLLQYAQVAGRENVMAGTDCGFGTVAGMQIVVPSVVWAKFKAMSEGTELATQRLWG